MVAGGDSLAEILDSLCQFVEGQADGVLASISLLDCDRLRHGAAHGGGPARRALAIAYRNRADPIISECLTPHAVWSSPESVIDARQLSVETAMLYLREGKLRNLVSAPVGSGAFDQTPRDRSAARLVGELSVGT